jgi:GAF domain-containing protein
MGRGAECEDGAPLGEQRLQRLLEVGRGLVGQLALDAVLSRVLGAACELTHARYAALGVLDHAGERLERFLTKGLDEQQRSRIGDLAARARCARRAHHRSAPVAAADGGRASAVVRISERAPADEQLFSGVPIRVGDEVFGNLYLTDKVDAEEFDEVDEATAVALAEWAAVGIDNARRHGGLPAGATTWSGPWRRLRRPSSRARCTGLSRRPSPTSSSTPTPTTRTSPSERRMRP